MGDGMWRMLAMAIAITQCKGGILLVDEIDTGLHYTVMAEMWTLIFGEAKRLNVQVFATSHSYDCVHSLAKICVNQNDADNRVSIQRIEVGNSKSVSYTEGEIRTAAERQTESSVVAEISQTKWLIVEGADASVGHRLDVPSCGMARRKRKRAVWIELGNGVEEILADDFISTVIKRRGIEALGVMLMPIRLHPDAMHASINFVKVFPEYAEIGNRWRDDHRERWQAIWTLDHAGQCLRWLVGNIFAKLGS